MTTSITDPVPLTFAAAYLVEDQDLHVNELAHEARLRWAQDAYRLGWTTAGPFGGSKVEVVDDDGTPWLIISALVRPIRDSPSRPEGVVPLPAPVETVGRAA